MYNDCKWYKRSEQKKKSLVRLLKFINGRHVYTNESLTPPSGNLNETRCVGHIITISSLSISKIRNRKGDEYSCFVAVNVNVNHTMHKNRSIRSLSNRLTVKK